MQSADPLTAGKFIGAVVLINVAVVVIGLRLAVQRVRGDRGRSVIVWPAYAFFAGSLALSGAAIWFVRRPGVIPLVADAALAAVVLWTGWLLWTIPFAASSGSRRSAA